MVLSISPPNAPLTKAIAALDGSELDGCKLNVKPRDKAPKKPAGGGFRRPPAPRAARPTAMLFERHPRMACPRMAYPRRAGREWRATHGGSPEGKSPEFAEDFFRRMPPPEAEPPAPRVSQSQLAESRRPVEDMPPIEPPPRRDFEVVRRPIRRTTGPKNFQVERRPLPRRV